jgi:hypothetical protein
MDALPRPGGRASRRRAWSPPRSSYCVVASRASPLRAAMAPCLHVALATIVPGVASLSTWRPTNRHWLPRHGPVIGRNLQTKARRLRVVETRGLSRPRLCSSPGADAGDEKRLRNCSEARVPESRAPRRLLLPGSPRGPRNRSSEHRIALAFRRAPPTSCDFWNSSEPSDFSFGG